MNGQFEIGDIKPTQYFFSIAVALGLLFAMTAGDTDESAILVFLRWQLQTVVPMALLIVTHRVLLQNLSFRALSPWLTLLISGLLGASLFAPVALLADTILESQVPSEVYMAELLEEWVNVTPPITVCWLLLNLPWVLGYRLQKASNLDSQPKSITADTQPLKQPAFMALLPAEKLGEILYLKSELHYLQVVTDKGSSLILYNIRDAISQIPLDSGLTVHRSYWVAYDAIDKLVRNGRQGKLSLKNGESVPVSRNNLKRVAASA